MLGFDIGGTKIAAGLVDTSGGVESFLVEPTHAARGPQQGLERLFALGRRALAESGVDAGDVGGVGIGCGGPLDADRGLLLSPLHLPGWDEVPIVAMAEEAFELPVTLENDATAAAAGEHRYGAGRGTRNMVYLTISTGVGGGVILDGHPYRGAAGNAAELGHVTVDWRGRECRGCGRRGCLEAYASGTSIAERAREAGLDLERASDVAAAAGAGDGVAQAVWAESVAARGCGVISIVNAFEPEVVVLGGGVSRVGEQLIAPVRERVRAEAMTDAGRATDVVAAALGDHVGVVGAAAIFYDRAGSGELAARA